MVKLIAAVGATCFLMLPLSAQSTPQSGPSGQTAPTAQDCEQVRQAVAQYGYKAAKRYAVSHYGKEAANYGDQCLTKKDRSKG
jgi:hypothetical protein